MSVIKAPQFEVTGVLVERSPTGRTEYTMVEKNTGIVIEFDMSNSKPRDPETVRKTALKVFETLRDEEEAQRIREASTVKVGDVI